MRREQFFGMKRADAEALLARAPVHHLATTSGSGAPILRVVHGVVVDGGLAFHGAPAGEKLEALGREAVVSVEEVVAEIPSWFVDAERACPATTLYESVQLHGMLEEERDPARKARALQALMEKLQPEGRHVPITHDHPLYRKAVDGILIVRIALERLDGKAKLGQNKKPEELSSLCELLWKRGRRGDVRAIERILAANPSVPTPPFLAGPCGTRFTLTPDPEAAAALLDGAYWHNDASRAEITELQRGATACVGVRAPGGELIATARALSDGARHAWIYDVLVRADWRGRGVGPAMLRLLLDHPSVRGAKRIRLATRDAMPVYEKLGFRPFSPAASGHTEMQLER
jgi:nitroimidazol reductase NimA-like FMN-containing flavoprotein (pyridoxamine 5'-phosphate oxidase superfamily)/GNAT superfamily N-acetyltransferase